MRQVSGFTGSVKEATDLKPMLVEASDTDLLFIQCQEVLRREVKNLMIESSKGKLSPAASKSLVDYFKLLDELKKKEAEELQDKTVEQLKELAGDKPQTSQT